MPAILFVAYASSAKHLFTPTDLEALLAVSRRNNMRDDITGLLLYRGGNFLQALEGPADAVQATLARIARDARHRSVVTLMEEWRDERLFGEWAMGFDDATRLDPSLHPGVSRFLAPREGNAPISADDSHEVFEFFDSFRDLIR